MLTHRFDDALTFASVAHRDQRRKGSGVPYISHLMAVSALVLEHGGDEDQAIAGLLHDAVEDQGGAAMAARIRDRFGPRVERIVLECSDSSDGQKAPWRDRKVAYLASIADKSDDAILVTACDKLHNASTILADHGTLGPAIWERFTGRRDGTLWYYRALAGALAPRTPPALATRIDRVVSEIERAAAGDAA